MRHVRLLTGMLFVLLITSIGHAQNYVTRIQDFQQHIELHRARVVQLGMALAESHFPEISQKDLKEFLKLHDSSKTTKEALPRLYQFYGKPPNSEAERERLKEIVIYINAIDQKVAEKYFKEKTLSLDMIETFYIIEKVADLVDRSMDPVAAEEFGRKLVPASQFLKEAELIRLSQWLEQRYEKVTSHLKMAPVNSCSRLWH